MPLQKFPLLQDNTRLVKFKDNLYKVRVKYKQNTFHHDRGLHLSQPEGHHEIEQTFRAVLYLSERSQALKTIATPNFMIQPFKIPWSFPSKYSSYSFQQNGKSLKVFDHMFEFHISNRESKGNPKHVAVPVESWGSSNSKTSGSESETNKAREAVIIVSNASSKATTRFGRTQDGQLYRVCPQDLTHRQGSSGRSDESLTNTKCEGPHERGNQSPKKKQDSSNKPLEMETEIHEERLVRRESDYELKRKRQNANKTESQVTAKGVQEQSNEYTLRKGSKNIHSKRKQSINTAKHNSTSPRDKYTVSLCELRELKRENVQPQRLRSRTAKSSEMKSRNEHFYEKNDLEQRNKSEIRQDEDPDKREKVVKLRSAKYEPEIRKSPRERKKHNDSSLSSEMVGEKKISNLSAKNLQKERAQVKTLQEQRKRRSKPRCPEILIETSSQSECETADQSVDSTDNDTRNVSVKAINNEADISPGTARRSSLKRKAAATTSENSKCNKNMRISSQSSESSSDEDFRRSPRKSRRLERENDMGVSATENQNTNSVPSSQDSSRSRKVKLYACRNSPQITGSRPVIEISSPRVSTVLPVKRNHTPTCAEPRLRSSPNVISPRITRQSAHDEELRRIQGLRAERPTQIYRDIMLATGKDRYLVEQAENAETDKLQQLYKATVPNQSGLMGKPVNKRRRSSGLWGKIMDTLVTPTKKYMFGKKK